LTNNVGSAASERAAVAPVIPTETPQKRLQSPTVRPAQKMENPETREEVREVSFGEEGNGGGKRGKGGLKLTSVVIRRRELHLRT